MVGPKLNKKSLVIVASIVHCNYVNVYLVVLRRVAGKGECRYAAGAKYCGAEAAAINGTAPV